MSPIDRSSGTGNRPSPPADGKSKGRRAALWLMPLLCGIVVIAIMLRSNHRKLEQVLSTSTNASIAARPVQTRNSNDAVSASAVSEAASLKSVILEADRAQELFQKGNEFLAQGKIAEAYEALEASVKLDPQSEDAHFNLAITLARLGRPDEAIREYQEALKIYPEYAEAHNNLGNLLKDQGRLEEALGHFQAALKEAPKNENAHNNMGVALVRLGRLDEAVMSFNRALDLNPRHLEARQNLGMAYMSQKRFDESTLEFQRLLQLQPGFRPAIQALALVQQKKAQQAGGR